MDSLLRAGAQCQFCYRPFALLRDSNSPFVVECGHIFCVGCIRGPYCCICNTEINIPLLSGILALRHEGIRPSPPPYGSLEEIEQRHMEAFALVNESSTITHIRTLYENGKRFVESQPRNLFKGLNTTVQLLECLYKTKEALVSQQKLSASLVSEGIKVKAERSKLLQRCEEVEQKLEMYKATSRVKIGKKFDHDTSDSYDKSLSADHLTTDSRKPSLTIPSIPHKRFDIPSATASDNYDKPLSADHLTTDSRTPSLTIPPIPHKRFDIPSATVSPKHDISNTGTTKPHVESLSNSSVLMVSEISISDSGAESNHYKALRSTGYVPSTTDKEEGEGSNVLIIQQPQPQRPAANLVRYRPITEIKRTPPAQEQTKEDLVDEENRCTSTDTTVISPIDIPKFPSLSPKANDEDHLNSDDDDNDVASIMTASISTFSLLHTPESRKVKLKKSDGSLFLFVKESMLKDDPTSDARDPLGSKTIPSDEPKDDKNVVVSKQNGSHDEPHTPLRHSFGSILNNNTPESNSLETTLFNSDHKKSASFSTSLRKQVLSTRSLDSSPQTPTSSTLSQSSSLSLYSFLFRNSPSFQTIELDHNANGKQVELSPPTAKDHLLDTSSLHLAARYPSLTPS